MEVGAGAGVVTHGGAGAGGGDRWGGDGCDWSTPVLWFTGLVPPFGKGYKGENRC